MKSIPYLVITNPASTRVQLGDLAVTASLFRAGEQLTGQEAESASVLARLHNPPGQVSTTWLELEPESQLAVLHGVFPNALEREGQYQLMVEAADLAAIADELLFQARRGFLSQLRHGIIYSVAGLSCLLFTVSIIFLIRARRLPKLTGSISAYLSSDEDVLLKQKRIFRKGWGVLHLRRRKETCGRWFLITSVASGGDEAVNIWYRSGLTLAKRRLYQDSTLESGKHSLRYA